jgi:glutamate 5-kinase
VDEGAAAKLRGEGKSLLPIGMTQVEGEFSRGDVIAVRAMPPAPRLRAGWPTIPARGAPAVPQASADFERLLGYMAEPEMVHRDNKRASSVSAIS